MENKNEKKLIKKNHFNTQSQKLEIKKEDLCKIYFYKSNLSLNNKNIFHDMEKGQNLDELEQVYNENLIIQNNRNKLWRKKTDTLKTMILHHKNIPERWILKQNYHNLLDKVMQDPIVLSYAIFSKDIYKKRSTTLSVDIDDIKKYYPLSSRKPKFISYINPYSKKSQDTIKKSQIRQEYANSLKNRKNKGQNIYITQTENNGTKNNNNNVYLNTDINKEKELPNIFGNIKKIKKNKNDDKKTEDKNELTMMTSLYFDENKLNEKKENKDESKNNNKNEQNNNENQEKTIKKQTIELPMII